MKNESLNTIHRLLRTSPERPREQLSITTREAEDDRLTTRPRIGHITCDGETHPFEYVISAFDTIAGMLSSYPVPVFINSVEITRIPVPSEPSITHYPARRAGEAPPPAQSLGHPADHRIPTINIDGVNYRNVYHGRSHRESVHIPNPDVSDELRLYCDHYRIEYHIKVEAPPDAADLFFMEGGTPTCQMSPETNALIKENVAAAKRRALEIIGTTLTLEEIESTRTCRDWQESTVVPKDGVTPVTVEFDRSAHQQDGAYRGPIIYQPKRPMCDSVAAHLQAHPELALLPITPPLDDPDFANLDCLEIRIMDGPARRKDPQHTDNDFRVASIEIDTIISQPGQPARQMCLSLSSVFLGDVENPQPILLRDLEVDVDELGRRVFEAYHHYPFIPRGADEQHAADFMQKAHAVARRAVYGNSHAYLQEVRRHWRAFAPHTPRPDSITDDVLLEVMADAVSESADQKTETQAR